MDIDLALIIKNSLLEYKELTKDRKLWFALVIGPLGFMYMLHVMVKFQFLLREWSEYHTIRDGTHKIAAQILRFLVLIFIGILWREIW